MKLSYESLKNKIEWRYRNAQYHLLRLFKKYEHKSGIIVFGSGRSGTTHLASVLASQDNFTLIDEPLKNASSYKVDKLGLTGWGQYIPEDEKHWPEAYSFFDRILSGNEFNPNHIPDNNSLFKTEAWVFKFIRANLLMPWLINNFEVRTPIYILRTPYAVVSSRLKHGGWGLHKASKLEKAVQIPNFKYFDQFYSRYEKLYQEATYLEELLTLG